MKYQFSFYTKADFDEIAALVLRSYSHGYPLFGLSRLEFSNGLHPKFLGFPDAWERTVGVFRENDRIAACAVNEGNDEGDVFFLFDSPDRAQDASLLTQMLFFSQTFMSCVESNSNKRFVRVFIPEEYPLLRELAEKRGFLRDWQQRILIRPFNAAPFPVELPAGYTFADGTGVCAAFAANIHMAAFNYGLQQVPYGTEAFSDLRRQPHYDPYLDLYILDPEKRPVAMATVWYDPQMPYCELEPLGVAWWERRKGLATAILNEAANRVMARYPACQGMTGGDQPFYGQLGFQEKAVIPGYRWETYVYPSWDPRSKEQDHDKLFSV